MRNAGYSHDYRRAMRGMSKPSRYGAHIKKHVHADGTKLDSKREHNRYCELLLLMKAGEISGLKVHPTFHIVIGGVPVKLYSDRYKGGRQMMYIADFSYIEDGKWKVEDVKMESGHRTEVYKIKRALMRAMGYEIIEV